MNNEQDQGYAKATWTPTRGRHGELHVPERPDRHQRPPRSHAHQRPRSRARAGRQQLRRQLLAADGRAADRWRYQRPQRRGLGLLGDPRAVEHGDLPRHRHADADRRAARRLGPVGDRQARHEGRPRRRRPTTSAATPSRAGLEWSRNNNFRNTTYIDDALVWTFAPHLSGFTGDAARGRRPEHRRFNPQPVSDFGGLISTINGLPNRASFYSQYDVDGNGTITSAELASRLTFTTAEPGRHASTTPGTSRPRTARRTPAPKAQLLRRRTSSVRPLHRSTSACAPSSGSTSPRPARTSSPSTGSSRRV